MRSARKAAGILAGVVLAAATPAAAQEAGRPYINLGVGASFLEGLQVTGVNGNSVSLNTDPGPMGVFALGYTFPYNLRAEIEYGYRHNSAKNITLPSGGTTPTSLNLNTNVGASSYMANGYYDFHVPSWPVIPHIGAGVGAADVKVNNIGKQWPFAWQAMAGAEYPVSYNAKVGLEYRFLGTESLNLRQSPVTLSSHANYYDHAVLLNFRWTFGSPPPPPPPIQPAAAVVAPAPPPPPPTREFTVYFDFNKATLTPEGRSIVQQAAAGAREAPVTHITVTGHTDTVGSAEFNQRLSERRAAAVRDELIKSGVPANEIVARGVGKTELAVPTANGVKEPRNRRAVIIEGEPGS
jgi:outer membrane protein OmpA-like peptidoglycan-associated protein